MTTEAKRWAQAALDYSCYYEKGGDHTRLGFYKDLQQVKSADLGWFTYRDRTFEDEAVRGGRYFIHHTVRSSGMYSIVYVTDAGNVRTFYPDPSTQLPTQFHTLDAAREALDCVVALLK